MPSTECLECGGTLALGDDVIVGEIAQCPDCGVEMEVLGTSPLHIGRAPEVQEDWGE